jgi:hypothetical protein
MIESQGLVAMSASSWSVSSAGSIYYHNCFRDSRPDRGRRTKFFPLVLSTTSPIIGSSQTVLYCAHPTLNASISTNDPSKLARYLFRDGG